MQKLTSEISVSQFSSFRWSFFQDVVKYASLGFGSMGIWRQKAHDFGFDSAADLLFEMQMKVSSLSWAGGFTGSEGNSFKLALEDGVDAVHEAYRLGADKLIVHAGSRNSHTHSHAQRLISTGLKEMLPVAQDFGVQLLLEPVIAEGNPWNFMKDLHAYLDLIEGFGEQEVGLVLDLFSVGNEDDFSQMLPTYAKRVSLVQIADRTQHNGEIVRCDLGAGSVPINDWIESLLENGYSGDFEIELHGPQFENSQYEETISRSRNGLSRMIQQVAASTQIR